MTCTQYCVVLFRNAHQQHYRRMLCRRRTTGDRDGVRCRASAAAATRRLEDQPSEHNSARRPMPIRTVSAVHVFMTTARNTAEQVGQLAAFTLSPFVALSNKHCAPDHRPALALSPDCFRS
jgi:hypothetical protein